MRILYVIGTSTGGVGTHVRAAARDIAAAGHDVRVIGPASTDEHFGFSDLDGVRFAPLALGTGIGPRDAGLVTRLRRLIDAFAPDVVHAHGFRAGLVALLATRLLRKSRRPRFIISLHNQAAATGLRGRVEAGIEKLLATGADTTLGASADLVERARDLGAADARFSPAAAPAVRSVTAEAAAATRAALASEFRFPEDALIVLSVGRVAPQKDYGTLIRALGRLAKNGGAASANESASVGASTPGESTEPARPLVFLIAGAADVAVQVALEEQYADLRRSLVKSATAGKAVLPHLHFLGARSDIAELDAAADIYLLTSVWEARALVLQEALIAGKAIISTSGGGSAELVGNAGILIAPGDDAALAAALTKLSADESLRTDLAARASARGAALPDEAGVAANLLAVYAETD